MPKSEFGRDRLERLHQIEGNHFWFTGRRQLVFGLLRQCPCSRSASWTLAAALAYTPALLAGRRLALDIRPEPRGTHRDPACHAGRSEHLPLSDASLTGMLMLDAGTSTTFSAARRAPRPASRRVVATVPAMPWPWSYRDRRGHKRRYTCYVFSCQCWWPVPRPQPDLLSVPAVSSPRSAGCWAHLRMRDREDLPGPLLNRTRWANRSNWLGRHVRWPLIVARCLERVG